MSKKVIIIWSCFIALFFIIGIFGLLNQSLLKTDEEKSTSYTPNVGTNVKKCSSVLDNINVIYQFKEDSNGNLSKVIINYYNSNQNLEEYETVANFVNIQREGLTANLNGDSANFQASFIIDISTFNSDNIEDLSSIGLVFENVDLYSTYADLIVSRLSNFSNVCDN